MAVHENLEYHISADGILTITIDLNECTEIHPRSGNPVIARTGSHQPIWLMRPGEIAEQSGLRWFIYVFAPKSEAKRQERLWPRLWENIQERRKEFW